MESLRGSAQQITLFYSGTVNVFDHVPAHKAQAIMLLLSDHCNSNTTGVADCGSDLSMQTSLHPHPSKNAVIGCAKASCRALRRSPTPSMPMTENTPITQFTKKQHPIIRNRSQAELPFARKASLARFLEKRKDRVLESTMKVEEVIGARGVDEGDSDEALGSPCKRMKH